MVRLGSLSSRVGLGRRGGAVCSTCFDAVAAQVEHAQLGELAEPEPAEQPVAVAELGGAVHPGRASTRRRRGGRGPCAPCSRPRRSRVWFSAPLLHWSLVTSWSSQVMIHGYFACGVLEVGVGLVLRVPLPVVGERDHLVGGLVRPDVDVVLAVAVLAGAVLVEVVAEVEHGVQVVARGEAAVGAEPAGLPVGAGDDAEAQVSGQRVARPARCGCGRRGCVTPS